MTGCAALRKDLKFSSNNEALEIAEWTFTGIVWLKLVGGNVSGKENFTQQLKVDDLAKKVNMSPSQFSREYGRLFGDSPARDISMLRETGAGRIT
jgi:hypothetical protein